jgi:hypothetical protein
MWNNTTRPRKPGHYLLTVQRANGTRFVGYAFWDGACWRTQSKNCRLRMNIIAWADKPAPFTGDAGPGSINLPSITRGEQDPWEQPLTRAQQSKAEKWY